jgi:hypothetical protein
MAESSVSEATPQTPSLPLQSAPGGVRASPPPQRRYRAQETQWWRSKARATPDLPTGEIWSSLHSCDQTCGLLAAARIRVRLMRVLPPREGVARRPAQILWLRDRCRTRRVAFRRATRDVSGTGPVFSVGLTLPAIVSQLLGGLLVAPGGAPLPPECLVATRPAGAALRPASRTPRESAPQKDEVMVV